MYPFLTNSHRVRIEIWLEGPYEFVRDVVEHNNQGGENAPASVVTRHHKKSTQRLQALRAFELSLRRFTSFMFSCL